MTEVGPNPAEFRATLRTKLAAMPPVGTQGRELRTAVEDAELAGPTPAVGIVMEPQAQRMKPNPAQGAGGSPLGAPPVTQGTPLDSIREKARDIARIDYDPTV